MSTSSRKSLRQRLGSLFKRKSSNSTKNSAYSDSSRGAQLHRDKFTMNSTKPMSKEEYNNWMTGEIKAGRRFFGSKPTMYQNKVNALTGALGPSQPAFWKNNFKLTGPAYSLAAQPLYYAPAKGFYVTSADVPASMGSVNFSNFGFGKPRRRSRRKSRKSRRSRKGSRKSRRRSRKGSIKSRRSRSRKSRKRSRKIRRSRRSRGSKKKFKLGPQKTFERDLLVYYNNPSDIDVKYPKMPSGWEWIGSGTLMNGRSKFKQDVQFSGNSKNKDKVKQLLKKTFTKYRIAHKIVDQKSQNDD
jgi:hypothetical protein